MNSFVRFALLPSTGLPEVSWWTVLARSIKQRTKRKRKERQARRDIRELMYLDDRMLADVGLTRADVKNCARYGRLPAWATDDAGK
jgi:Domain of unknown function (DUF1127).